MEMIEHTNEDETIDRYEVDEGIIVITYCDGHKEEVMYSQEKEQEIVREQLNQMKITINQFKDFDFHESITNLKYELAWDAVLALADFMFLNAPMFLFTIKKDIIGELEVLLITLGAAITNNLASKQLELFRATKEEIQELKGIREMIKTDQLYINNLELLEHPIEIVNFNQELQVVKITPNNIDDFSFEQLDKAIKKVKNKHQVNEDWRG